MKKIFSLLSVALVAVLMTVAPSIAADVIKIGVAGPHTGDLAPFGIPTVHAAKIVTEKYNKNGGILGKKIELIVLDDQCKPEVATNVATSLVTSKVVGVIGHICSGATKAALPIYKQDKIPVISPSATNPSLTEIGYPVFFRTIAPDDAQGKLQADFIINKLHAKRVAIIHDKGDYGKGLATYVKNYIEKSGKAKVVLFEGITPGAMDYSAVVQKIKRARPDVVMFGGYHPEASKIVMTMRRKRLKAPFISGDGIKNDKFIQVAGKYAEGVYASGPKDISGNPLYKVAFSEHKKKYGTKPGAFYFNAYAATQALFEAIKKAGTTDFDKVTAALRSNYVETPLGKIKFDKKGEAEGVGFAVYQVRNGKFVQIYAPSK
ncbi:branched-chain amino acid ABC transporter substrate-binding protein [Desulfurobacterium atlanticum]|uniref:L-leucine-binding protein /L-isoleucine-binding protein /L-valine-binding protein /amino acid/amide ABC transporter substrate-binding protein, HAAT family n=1 Tax=Desulfurobacterium atlanticum TaxID=240169 RepID=A0A238ZTZ2_9BACT|nr:branched-chain amino acid ABC transporter substrate-binding protein [Desulfurobacterium atlanticum]SNR86897.1 L-leucine-binding protein /L-isoleucine-binding protein /L-valine-binding protein /amino acid/amide ABC transporter substrate-binding protein, HAAT family [Desulfurobacterium atlanticum]